MRALATLILAPYVNLGLTLTPELAGQLLRQFPADGAPLDLGLFPSQKSGRLVFAAERAARILPELHELHELHWKEREAIHGTRYGPMVPNYPRGLAYEQEGRMLQLTARFEGVLVGNIRMYLTESMHTSRLIATEDTVYLRPQFRKGRAAFRFLMFMEACMRVLTVTEIFMDATLANPAADKLLAAMGYEHIANRRHKILEYSHVQSYR